MKKAVLSVIVLALVSLSAPAGEYLLNDTERPARSLRVTFSNPVVLTAFGDVLMDVAPQGESVEFVFSGGEVEDWGGHWLRWEPSSNELLDYEWRVGPGLNLFADSSLEAAVREAIGKPDGELTVLDLEGLHELQVLYPDRDILDLEGIQDCVDLTDLVLLGTQLSDISPLASLINLTNLSLTANQIVDISPLAGLTNLAELDLSINQIVDITSLSHLTNLTRLYLGANQIVDISSLSHLTNLTRLRLGANQIVDISSLSHLTNLTELWLSRNGIVDISSLSHLTNLTELWLRLNNISDIAPLVNNTGIDRDDHVNLMLNRLFLLPGYPNMLDIEALQRRGVDVDYIPQR